MRGTHERKQIELLIYKPNESTPPLALWVIPRPTVLLTRVNSCQILLHEAKFLPPSLSRPGHRPAIPKTAREFPSPAPVVRLAVGVTVSTVGGRGTVVLRVHPLQLRGAVPETPVGLPLHLVLGDEFWSHHVVGLQRRTADGRVTVCVDRVTCKDVCS